MDIVDKRPAPVSKPISSGKFGYPWVGPAALGTFPMICHAWNYVADDDCRGKFETLPQKPMYCASVWVYSFQGEVVPMLA